MLDKPRVGGQVEALWSDASFVIFFVGNVVSFAGMQVTRVVLPILIYQLTGSAMQTALLITVQAVPNYVFGLFAGAVADRVDRRLLMASFNVMNSLALASVPVLHALGALTIERLYLAAFLSAVTYVFSEAAEFGALPVLVGRGRVVAATSLLHASWTITGIVGLPLGGLLAATLGPGPTLWIDVGSYLFIAGSLLFIRRSFNTERSGSTSGHARLRRTLSDIRDGLGFIRRHEVLWPLTVLTIGSSVTTGAATGLLVVYGVRQLGLAADDARIGLLYAAGAAGALCAAVILPQLVKRVGPGHIIVVGFALRALLLGSLAVAPTLLIGVLLLLLWEGVTTATSLNVISLRQQVTPDGLQSRVNTTGRMIVAAGQSGGAALGGLLTDQFSIQAAYLLMALVVGLTALLAGLSPVRRLDTAAIQRHLTEADAYLP